MLSHSVRHIEATLPHLCELALGGTAVGTGLNTHPEYAVRVANEIATLTRQPLSLPRINLNHWEPAMHWFMVTVR